MNFIDSRTLEIKKQIENDIATITAEDFDDFFIKLLSDKTTISFINYYNKTVLDQRNEKTNLTGV